MHAYAVLGYRWKVAIHSTSTASFSRRSDCDRIRIWNDAFEKLPLVATPVVRKAYDEVTPGLAGSKLSVMHGMHKL
jgi:hypothetical protein